jgi:hypothetical protein
MSGLGEVQAPDVTPAAGGGLAAPMTPDAIGPNCFRADASLAGLGARRAGRRGVGVAAAGGQR